MLSYTRITLAVAALTLLLGNQMLASAQDVDSESSGSGKISLSAEITVVTPRALISDDTHPGKNVLVTWSAAINGKNLDSKTEWWNDDTPYTNKFGDCDSETGCVSVDGEGGSYSMTAKVGGQEVTCPCNWSGFPGRGRCIAECSS
ncbi:hypothetical protein THASP1DRAFT_30473 [Thamnocephalis sphaerospora]|uniref:Uncharacterized protein n=1 Tax=Thamnocephalis sphaerospora TaxID=78915 RepID=A0A4P9XP26_9FUNG|nr:hypothetical protein THASP1DRAFT_30473 [Thamnocephalis sphaerospora]|eukprot:RKP07718.1 hypothetical protein THASP1DRAFT_30473 [Thamnocephalis sphaerospora]